MRNHWRWAVAGGLGLSAVAFGGRPLETDDAFPVDHKHFELELGAAASFDSDDRSCEVPIGLAWGILPRLEVGIGFGGLYQRTPDGVGGHDSNSGIGDLTLGFKALACEQSGVIPALAIAGEVKFPTADDDCDLGSGEFDYDLTLIASFVVNDKLSVHANVGYAWLGDCEDQIYNDCVHYGLAATYALDEKWEPVIEVIAETPMEDSGPTSVGINAGVRYALTESIVLDAAVGTRLANDWPDLTLTAGFTWSF